MKCPLEKLGAYLDGELRANELRQIEEHLAACQSCRVELGRLKKLDGLLRNLGSLSAPADFETRLSQRLEGTAKRVVPMTRFAALKKFAVAAAAALILTAGGIFMVGNSPRQPVSVPSAQYAVQGPEELLKNLELLNDLTMVALLADLEEAQESDPFSVE